MSKLLQAPWRRTARFAAMALACLLACLVSTLALPVAPAQAHAALIQTDPSNGSVLPDSPATATLTFNEPVILPADAVMIYDAAGDVVPARATSRDSEVVVTLPALDQGTYVVVWNVVSADAHPIAGSLTFSVGKASPRMADLPEGSLPGGQANTGSWLASLTQATHYLGLFLALGIAAFLVLLLPEGVRADVARRRLRLLAATAAGISIAAGILLVMQSPLPREALFAELLLIAGLASALAPIWLKLSATPSRLLLGLGAMSTTAALTSVGHTRSFGPTALVITTDVLHVLAASLWLGGLVGLAMTLPGLHHRPNDIARTVTRFSTVAAGLLAAVVVSGVLLAWRIVGSWENLFQTRYGTLLIIKIALVGLCVAVAGWNRSVLLPRNRSVLATVRVEAAALLSVLIVTGVLVNQSPTLSQTILSGIEPEVASSPIGQYQVFATLSPTRMGATTLRVQIQDESGEPVEPPYAPEVSLRGPEVNLGQIDVASEAAGTWSAPVMIPRAGQWQVQVSLRLSAFENPVSVLSLRVP